MTVERGLLGSFRLDGKVALVTGSSRGIGRAIALGLAEAGARVVVNGRTPETVAAVTDEVRSRGGEALAVPADVGQADAVDRLFAQAVGAYGQVDILVNNAGVSPFYKRAEDVTEAEWDLVIDSNLKSAFLCSCAAGRLMKLQGGGVVINVSSILGLVAMPRLLVYCVAKGGIGQLTRVLAVEWAPFHIRVNAIAPGWVETDMTRGLLEHPRLGEELRQKTPMMRAAAPDEIVGAALYLASDAASFVTGHLLSVDGGWTAW